MSLWIRFLCVGVLAAAAAANATIFKFDGTVDKTGTSTFVPFYDDMKFADMIIGNTMTTGYGDYVSSATQTGRKVKVGPVYQNATFTYDVGQEGWTPNVRAYFDNEAQVPNQFQNNFYRTGYKDLGGVIYPVGKGSQYGVYPYKIVLNLIGESGHDVKVYDLQLGTWVYFIIPATVNVYAITLTGLNDGTEDWKYTKGALLVSKTVTAPNTGWVTVPLNVSAPAVRIEIIDDPDGVQYGFDSLGLKNLRIGQGPGAAYCGDTIFGTTPLLGDVNKDCKVNLGDLQLVASQWLNCITPAVCN